MKKRDIIIVTLCVASALVCIALTFWGNIKNNGVLTTDSFIGIIASFIGVCTTIIVGFQIANFVKIHDAEKQIQEVQEERGKLQEDKERLHEEIKYIGTELSNAFILLSELSEKDVHRALAKMLSISCADTTSEPDITLSRYNNLKEAIQKLNTEDKQKLSKFVYKLKDLKIPDDIEHYTEIMKLHIDIIDTLEKCVKADE